MSAFSLQLDFEGFERDKFVHTILEDNLLPKYLINCRWFAGKNRPKWRPKVLEAYRMSHESKDFFFTIIQVTYPEGDSEQYMLPLTFIAKDSQKLEASWIISEAKLDSVEGFLLEAFYDQDFRTALFEHIVKEDVVDQKFGGSLSFTKGKGLKHENTKLSFLPAIDSSNTAMVYDNKYFFKLYRKLYRDTNPEVEMLQYITQNSDFKQIPRFGGGVNLMTKNGDKITLGLLVEVVANDKDNWSKTGDYLNDFIGSFVEGNFQVKENVFSKVSLLGLRTAQMHEALFNVHGEESFRSEPFDRTYRRYLHEKLEKLLENRYAQLTDNYLQLDEDAQGLAWKFMEAKDTILDFVDQILTKPFRSYRTRVHGDYHLGQVLVQGEELIIIDFEGEPESSIDARKIKHSPLKDVAGMIRSYHYAVSAKLFNAPETKALDSKVLQRAADRWFKLMKDTYLEEYVSYFGLNHPLLYDTNEINYLLQFHLLEKAVYELGYELNYRPSWVKIPLKGISDVLVEIEKIMR
jgi:maltokinase